MKMFTCRWLIVVAMGLLFLTARSIADDAPPADPTPMPDDSVALTQEAADHFSRQEYKEAAACYQKVIDQHPNSLFAWSNLGVVRYQLHDYEGAQIALEKSIALSPTDAFSYANLGLVYYETHKYDDAIKTLETAVKLEPKDAKSWDYLGCCYSITHQTEKAQDAFQHAIEHDPNLGDAYFNLGVLYATKVPPDQDQAKIYYRRAQDLGIGSDSKLGRLVGPAPVRD